MTKTRDGRLTYDGVVWRYVSNNAIPPMFVVKPYVASGEISKTTAKQMQKLDAKASVKRVNAVLAEMYGEGMIEFWRCAASYGYYVFNVYALNKARCYHHNYQVPSMLTSNLDGYTVADVVAEVTRVIPVR